MNNWSEHRIPGNVGDSTGIPILPFGAGIGKKCMKFYQKSSLGKNAENSIGSFTKKFCEVSIAIILLIYGVEKTCAH